MFGRTHPNPPKPPKIKRVARYAVSIWHRCPNAPDFNAARDFKELQVFDYGFHDGVLILVLPGNPERVIAFSMRRVFRVDATEIEKGPTDE